MHGPPGSAPPALAAAFCEAVREANVDDRAWRLVDRGGDPGVDAMETLFSRPGDPDLISTCTPVFIQAPLLRAMARTHRDLTPVARLVADRYLLVARADARWSDAGGFLADIARRPTRTGGYFKGGINHLLGLAIGQATGGDVEFVLVENEPATWTALVDGRIDWACGVPVEVLEHIEAGTFKALAVLDDSRFAGLPEVPTLAEAGADVTVSLWRGLMGPPALAAEALTRWHRIAEAAIRTDSWRAYLARNGQTDGYLSSSAFNRFLESEWDWYERHLGLAGVLPTSAERG
jgi:putative tricarboxylic transport membrane protein